MDDQDKDRVEIQKILAEIKLITAGTTKRHQDIRYAPWGMILTSVGAGAGLFAAATAFAAAIIKYGT